MSASYAIKPKYATRGAIDKVLNPDLSDSSLVDVVKISNLRQLRTLLDTSYVAAYVGNKFYPLDDENIDAQYVLIESGETPTVEESEDFGTLKLESFLVAGIDDKIQDSVVYYNGILSGNSHYVSDPASAGVDAKGCYVVLKFDSAAATSAGYSNVEFNGKALNDGDNYILINTSYESVGSTNMVLTATKSDEAVSSYIENRLVGVVLVPTGNDEEAALLPDISVDGVEFTSLTSAFANASSGSTITINKSIEQDGIINLTTNKVVNLVLNNADVHFTGSRAGIQMTNGTLNISGTGMIYEDSTLSPIRMNNTDSNVTIYVNISGVTLKGAYAIIIAGKTYNCHLTAKNASFISTVDGVGVYVNGTSTDAVVDLDNVTCTAVDKAEAFGVYMAGPADMTIRNSTITGIGGGLEVRAGNLEIYNTTIECTGSDEPTMKPNGNGTTSYGVGLAVAQHTTKKNISVIAKNCTFKGMAGFMQGNPQKIENSADYISLSFADCVFEGKTKAVTTLTPAEDCKKFLSDGRYNNEPDAIYLKSGYTTKQMISGTYQVVAE